MSPSCPQRWKICNLHYWQQLKITPSSSVYLLSISSNMDITCCLLPHTHSAWCKLSQHTTSFKGALISALVLYEYIPYAWALSSMFTADVPSIVLRTGDLESSQNSRDAFAPKQPFSFFFFLLSMNSCSRWREAQSCVHSAWSILGRYRAISLTLLNRNGINKSFFIWQRFNNTSTHTMKPKFPPKNLSASELLWWTMPATLSCLQSR